MKALYIPMLLAVACGSLQANAQAERTVTYARPGTTITLDLNWTADNYGTVQWQKSSDGGYTWADIANATSPALTVNFPARQSQPLVYRAVVNGDPSCPAAIIEREVRPVKFTSSATATGFNAAEITVSAVDFGTAAIAEYGYAANYASLERDYTVMNRVKTGEVLPASDEFTITCTGLEPNTTYAVRPWFKTADGSIIFGTENEVTTTDGICWSSEDWIIEKNRLRPRLKVSSMSKTTDVEILIGTDRENLTSYKTTEVKGGVYSCATIRGLLSGTDYLVVARAKVDGVPVEIEKTVRTWSDYSSMEVDETSSGIHHTIRWDREKKLTNLTPEGIQVEYPRMCRVDDNTILFAYHGGNGSDHWKNSYLRISHDNGRTWSVPTTIFNCEGTEYGDKHWRICNPELTRLANGWIILTVVANYRVETNENCKVLASLSKDGGETWGDPIIVGRGRTWEPQVIQLPNGELELLVSSEAKWWEPRADNILQEIVSARSTDNGETWTSFVRASFKPGARDGMPVAIVMQGNKGVLFIEESVNGGVPPTLQHRPLDGVWETTDWDGQNDNRRWRSRLNSGAGAPYMIQLPTGEIVMTAHTNQTGSVWQTCRPQVVITDNTGENASSPVYPLDGYSPLPSGTGAYYNSLFLKDSETVWLLVTKARYEGSNRKESAIMMLEGKIVKTR